MFDLEVNIQQGHNCIIASFPQHSIVWKLPKDYYTTDYILSLVGISSPENWFPHLLVRELPTFTQSPKFCCLCSTIRLINH